MLLKLERLKPKKHQVVNKNKIKGKARKWNTKKGTFDWSIVTKCTQVQQASVSWENHHENPEYLQSSILVQYYWSILSPLFSLSSPWSSPVYFLFFHPPPIRVCQEGLKPLNSSLVSTFELQPVKFHILSLYQNLTTKRYIG